MSSQRSVNIVGFEPFKPMPANGAAASATVDGGKDKNPAPAPTMLTETVSLDDLPYFLREDVPDRAPESWTAPFGWRPPTKL